MISFKDYMTELTTPGPKLSSKQIVKKIKKLGNQVPTLKGWDKVFSKFSAKELHSRKDLEGMLPAKVASGDINRLFFEGKGAPESWEAGFKRRVVKTTKPEHKEKGYNWRIKGKDRPEVTIKLYKSKPDFAEFKKQMKRVAGHEFG
tara:strand:+ start:3069 stop:3506 length:438 start_codon:yes stop_codon:yes gene_type:complete